MISQQDGASDTIKRFADEVLADPIQYLRRKRKCEIKFLWSVTQRLSLESYIRRAVSEEIIRQSGEGTIKDLLQTAQKSGDITKRDLNLAVDLMNSMRFRERSKHVRNWLKQNAGDAPESLVDPVRSLLVEPEYARELTEMAARYAPHYSFGPYRGMDEGLVGVGAPFTVIRRSQVADAFKDITDINRMIGSMSDLRRELGAGRHNLHEVTALTMVPFYALERLDSALNAIGIGMSSRSKGSTLEFATSFALKRVLPVYLGVTGVSYLNYLTGATTGHSLEQRYWRTVAQARLDLAHLTDYWEQLIRSKGL